MRVTFGEIAPHSGPKGRHAGYTGIITAM